MEAANELASALKAAIGCDVHSVVWRFDQAPDLFKKLSKNGGDEDWVVLVFTGDDAWHPWTEALGCFDVQEFDFKCGATVLIGCHS